MGLSQGKIGVIFIALGVIFLAYHLQKNAIVEGFSFWDDALDKYKKANDANSQIPQVELKPPSIPVNTAYQGLELLFTDLEIRNKYNLILAARDNVNSILVQLLDPQVYGNINLLFSEVDAYVKAFPNNMIVSFEAASDKDKATMLQAVYTARAEIDILYTIYFTYPSMVISTNTVISSKLALPGSIAKKVVANQAVAEIQDLVAWMPQASKVLPEVITTLHKNVDNFVADSSVAQFNVLIEAIDAYILASHTQQQQVQLHAGTLKVAYGDNLNSDKTLQNTYLSALTNIETLFKTPYDLLTTISNNIKTKFPSYAYNTNAKTVLLKIDTETASIKIELDKASVARKNFSKLVNPNGFQDYVNESTREGFQSSGNPYNLASPNLTQAYELAFTKKSLVDDVFIAMRQAF